MQIKKVTTATDLERIKEMFAEYFDWLIVDNKLDMSYQGVEDELIDRSGSRSLWIASAFQPSRKLRLRLKIPFRLWAVAFDTITR